MTRVNSPNSGCLLNIGNGPQSGPPLYTKAKGCESAHQFIMGPKPQSSPSACNADKGSSLCRDAYILYLVQFRYLVNLP